MKTVIWKIKSGWGRSSKARSELARARLFDIDVRGAVCRFFPTIFYFFLRWYFVPIRVNHDRIRPHCHASGRFFGNFSGRNVSPLRLRSFHVARCYVVGSVVVADVVFVRAHKKRSSNRPRPMKIQWWSVDECATTALGTSREFVFFEWCGSDVWASGERILELVPVGPAHNLNAAWPLYPTFQVGKSHLKTMWHSLGTCSWSVESSCNEQFTAEAAVKLSVCFSLTETLLYLQIERGTDIAPTRASHHLNAVQPLIPAL